MGRVKFKHARPKDLETRRRLLALLAPQVKVFELFPVWDGIIVRTGSDDDEDIIFREATQKKLHEAGFTAVMPPELRSRRTVICFRIDELAYEYEAAEMKDELERQQDWLQVDEVYKFTGTRTIKIICASCDVARRALDSGVLMFYISIPPTQMKIEDYTPLMACNRCQAIEAHHTSKCPRPQEYKVCSECASTEHTFRDCQSLNKKCINCGQAHSARAMRCPERKKAQKKKQANMRKEREQKKSHSYAQAAQVAPAPDPSPGYQSPGWLVLLEAHLVDCAVPGIFQEFLSEGLSKNGLPDAQMPPGPPSQDIIRAIAGDSVVRLARKRRRKCRNCSGDLDTASLDDNAASPGEASQSADEESSSSEEGGTDHEGEKEEGAHDENSVDPIQIYVLKKRSDVFPEVLTPGKLRESVAEGRYKVVHTGKSEANERVRNWLQTTCKTIDPPFCKSVPDKSFKDLQFGPAPPNHRALLKEGRKTRQTK